MESAEANVSVPNMAGGSEGKISVFWCVKGKLLRCKETKVYEPHFGGCATKEVLD